VHVYPNPPMRKAYADPVSGTGPLSQWWNEEGRFDPRAARVLWLDDHSKICDIQTDVIPETIIREVKDMWGRGWRGPTETLNGRVRKVAIAFGQAPERPTLREVVAAVAKEEGRKVTPAEVAAVTREDMTKEKAMLTTAHHWAYFDYKDGWVGLRVEPEDQDRANAIKAAIPAAERKYLAHLRRWVFKPKWCAAVVQILQEHCPEVPVILEEKNSEILQTLLVGPRRYLQGNLSVTNPPEGRLFGPISSIGDWPDR
jgi:hypothetical protein